MGKKKFIDVKSIPNSTISDGSNNHIDNSIVIKDNNIYNYNIIQNVINDSKCVNDDGFRNLLWSIFKNTHEDNHVFSGFVNNIDIKHKKLYVANIFWNKRVYATNHSVLYPENIIEFIKGDFIIFKGKIDNYTRKDGSKDIGIENIKLIKKVKFPNLTIKCCEKECIDLSYLKSLTYEELRHLFDIQVRRIGSKIEKYIDLTPDVYKSILFTIMYENSKEQEMITTRLNILDGNNDLLKLAEWIMYIRYLVCEVNMISPYMIYNMLLLIFNEHGISMSEEYQYYTTLAKYSGFISGSIFNDINDSFNHYLNEYIKEFQTILKF